MPAATEVRRRIATISPAAESTAAATRRGQCAAVLEAGRLDADHHDPVRQSVQGPGQLEGGGQAEAVRPGRPGSEPAGRIGSPRPTSRSVTVPGTAPVRTASTMTTTSQPSIRSSSAVGSSWTTTCTPSGPCARTSSWTSPATTGPIASSPRSIEPSPTTSAGRASVGGVRDPSLVLDPQVEEVGGARDAGVVGADRDLALARQFVVRQVQVGLHERAQVGFDGRLVLRRRWGDLRVEDRARVVDAVAVVEQPARGLGGAVALAGPGRDRYRLPWAPRASRRSAGSPRRVRGSARRSGR